MPARQELTQAPSESVPDGAWRKFHKITPLANGGAIWVIVGIFLINVAAQMLEPGGDALYDSLRLITLTWVLIALGGLIAVTAVVVLLSWISWRYQSFAVVNSGVHKRSGVIFKNHEQVRWDRIQTVEIEQRLFGRIFGFASVKVDTAGSEPAIDLGLLTMADSGKLRKEILTGLANARAGRPIGLGMRASDIVGAESAAALPPGALPSNDADLAGHADHQPRGVGEAPAAPATPGEGAHLRLDQHADAPAHGKLAYEQPASGVEIPVFDPDDLENDQLIFELPTSRLIVSSMLNLGFISMALMGLAVAIVSIALREITFLFLIIALGSGVFTWAKNLFSAYGTKVSVSSNGLRVRSGLTKLTTRSIPPQRLHAIVIHQPMLWRRADWWKVTGVLAGGNEVDSLNDLTRLGRIISVGTRVDVLRVLWMMLPSAGTDDDVALLRDALDGSGTGRFFLSAPRRARWVDPITWKSRGVCLTPKVAVFRTGRWARKVAVVWQDHTQSLRVSQGPLQRRMRLGAIRLDLVGVNGNAAYQKNMAIEDVERMLWVENGLTAQARHVGVTESIEDWQRRVCV